MVSRFYKSANLISQQKFKVFLITKQIEPLLTQMLILSTLSSGGKSYADTLLEIHSIWGPAELSALPDSRRLLLSLPFHKLKI